jgi:very-short-patch-repair endonuclease
MRLAPHANTPKDYRRARALRNNASPIENKLWGVLREAAKAVGLKFRRQQVIHPYIADFACMEARLLIELDGDSHSTQEAYDQTRENYLRSQGFKILHFPNHEITHNVDGVTLSIINQAIELTRNSCPQQMEN